MQWQHNQIFDILVLEDVMGTMDALNIPTVFLQEFEQFFCCRFHHLYAIIIIHIDTYYNWIILLYGFLVDKGQKDKYNEEKSNCQIPSVAVHIRQFLSAVRAGRQFFLSEAG